MGLLTAPTCQIFLSVACSSVHYMDGLIIHGFLIIVHGQRPWTTSLSSIHGHRPPMDIVHGRPHYRPWETSSIINHILVQEHFLISLGGS